MDHSSFPISFAQLIALTSSSPGEARYHPPSSLIVDDWERASVILIESAIRAKLVDFQAPVGAKGFGPLLLWDSVFRGGLPFHLLALSADQDPHLGPTVQGVPAFLRALHHVFSDSAKGKSMSRAMDWLKVASPAAIYALDAPSQGAGAGLLSWLVNHKSSSIQKASAEEWVELIDALAEKGIQWSRCHPSALASPQLPPNLLQALSARGLDLLAEFDGVPTWKRILDLREPRLAREVSALLDSADAPSGSAEQAMLETEKSAYLAEFYRLKTSSGGRRVAGQAEEARQKVVDHLQSRPDWASVADSDGRSAFFHAVLANPGVVRSALQLLNSPALAEEERADWAKALTHRDSQGRNIWFYLLPRSGESTFTESLVQGLLHVVPSSKASNGDDWTVQLLADVSSSLRAFVLPGDPSTSSRLPIPGIRDNFRDRIFPMLWGTLPEESQKRAIAGACRNAPASRDVLGALPESSITVPAKVLSRMMYSPLEFVSNGPAQGAVKRLMPQIEHSEGFLPVSSALLEKVGARLNKALTSKSASDKAYGRSCFEVLERLALHTRMATELQAPSKAAGPRSRF